MKKTEIARDDHSFSMAHFLAPKTEKMSVFRRLWHGMWELQKADQVFLLALAGLELAGLTLYAAVAFGILLGG